MLSPTIWERWISLMHRRRINPYDSGHARPRIPVGVTKNRAEEERILGIGQVGHPAYRQFELPFQHQTELFAPMLNRVLATALRLNNMDIGLQQRSLAKWDQPFVFDALAPAQGVDFKDRAPSVPKDNIAIGGRAAKKGCQINIKRMGDSLQGGERGHRAVGLDLRQHALRAAGDIGKSLLAHPLGETGVANTGSKQQGLNGGIRHRQLSMNIHEVE
jgi:hypothetical protein